MVCGPVRLLQFSQLPPSGCICQPTLSSSTMYSPVLRENSPNRFLLTARTSLTALSTTGCTKSQVTKSGICHKRCTDGSDGKTVLTFSWLTSQRQAGSSCPTVALIQLPTQLTESTPLSMCITTTFTQMLTNSPAKPAARKVLAMANFCQSASSLPKTSGSESIKHTNVLLPSVFVII